MNPIYPMADTAEVLAALKAVSGYECDRSRPDWEVMSARELERVMGNPEQFELLFHWVKQNSLPNKNTGQKLLGRPIPFSVAENQQPNDGIFENLPTGSTEEDVRLATLRSEASSKKSDVDETDAIPSSDSQEWVAPSVLGFSDDLIQSSAQVTRIHRILGETRRRLELHHPPHKPSLIERVQAVLAPKLPDDWVISLRHPAPNYTVVETRHGSSLRVILQSVASGPYLYIVLIDSDRTESRDRVSLEDEEAGAQHLERMFVHSGDAASKALEALRRSLERDQNVPSWS